MMSYLKWLMTAMMRKKVAKQAAVMAPLIPLFWSEKSCFQHYLNPSIGPTGCETTGREDPIWTPTRHLQVKSYSDVVALAVK